MLTVADCIEQSALEVTGTSHVPIMDHQLSSVSLVCDTVSACLHRQIDKPELPAQSAKRRACVFSVQCGTHTHLMAASTTAEAQVSYGFLVSPVHPVPLLLVNNLLSNLMRDKCFDAATT